MTTIIMPGIRHIKKHLNNGSKEPVLAKKTGQINDFSTVLVVEGEEGEKGGLEAQITSGNYYFAFEALGPLADWLEEPGKFWRVGDRRCWSLGEVVGAIEVGEWGA